MAAPTNTPPGTPSGYAMPDGFSTKVTFAARPTASFWEQDVKTMGVDGGEPLDITSMRNVAWHTMRAPTLKKAEDIVINAFWNPRLLYQVTNQLINVEGAVSINYPDAATLDIFGYLRKYDPSANKNKQVPTVALTVVVTNYDPVNHVEAVPVLTEALGT